MITENDVPRIRDMARQIRESLTARKHRRQDWPLLARVCLTIERLCEHNPPKLRSIEQKMTQAISLFRQSQNQSRIEDYLRQHGSKYWGI